MAKPSVSAQSPNVLVSQAAGGPLIVSSNVPKREIVDLDDDDSVRWTRDVSASTVLRFVDTNRNDLNHPCSRAFDGRLTPPTRPLGTSGIKQYALLIDLGDTQDVDTIMIKPTTNLASGTTVKVVLSTANDFAVGDSVEIFSRTIYAPSRARLVSTSLGNAIDGYGGVWSARYVSIRFTSTSDLSPPEIGEIWIGQRRQLTFGPQLPYDPKQIGVAWDDHVSSGGQRSRTLRFAGQSIRDVRMVLADFSAIGAQDDRETAEVIMEECRYGGLPVLWIDNGNFVDGSTEQRQATLLAFFDSDEISRPYAGPTDQEWAFTLIEVPEFALEEG